MATKHFRATDQASIPLPEFYGRLDTKTLQKILAGFEFQFDKVHKGESGYPPVDWLSKRISLVAQLLEERGVKATLDKPSTMKRIQVVLRKSPDAARITKWNGSLAR